MIMLSKLANLWQERTQGNRMLFLCDVPVDLSRVSMELADVSGSLTIVVLDLISDTAIDMLREPSKRMTVYLNINLPTQY